MMVVILMMIFIELFLCSRICAKYFIAFPAFTKILGSRYCYSPYLTDKTTKNERSKVPKVMQLVAEWG